MSDNPVPVPVTGFSTSSSIGELTKALSLAHKDFKPVLKDANNPFFKSKYADLAGVIDATSDALSKQELAVIQSPGRIYNGHILLTTLLSHSSGEWIKDELELPIAKFDAQGTGSAITYARRYAYQAIVGVAAEDDDGNAASQKFEKQADGSFAKNPPPSPKPTETVQTKPAAKVARKKESPDAGKPWGGEFEPKTATTPGSPENIHGVTDIQDSEIQFPGDDKPVAQRFEEAVKSPEPLVNVQPGPHTQKTRLADEKERKNFMDRLIGIKNKGFTGIREYLLKESGETITNNIPYAKMESLVAQLEAAEKAGTLKTLLEAK